MFTTATWKASLRQAVGGFEPGDKVKLAVPVNIHFDGRGGGYDADDTLLEVFTNDKSTKLWMTKELDRQWQYVEIHGIADVDGEIVIVIEASVKWEHQTAFFFDAITLEVEDQPVTDCKGLPREQYKRRMFVVPQDATLAEWLTVCEKAYENRQSVSFSYDDAGIGALPDKKAILYGLRRDQRDEFTAWYAEHYPCTEVVFRNYPVDFEIYTVVNDLPKHDTKTYSMRDVYTVKTLIIHHTTGDAFDSTEDIASYHVNTKGWPGIGYHYLIDGAGRIERTNWHKTISYHASYHNDDSIGISLKGSFVGDAQPSDDQIAATAWLVNKLRGQLPIETVIGHKNTAYSQTPGHGTRCPGDTWESWRNKVS